MEGFRDRALYYRDIMLPLHERIVNESQLQYNAMQLGPIQLLRAREQQIETAVAYIEALRDYWLARGDARTDFERPATEFEWNAGRRRRRAPKMADQAGH